MTMPMGLPTSAATPEVAYPPPTTTPHPPYTLKSTLLCPSPSSVKEQSCCSFTYPSEAPCYVASSQTTHTLPACISKGGRPIVNDDVWCRVFSFLPFQEVNNVGTTCKYFKYLPYTCITTLHLNSRTIHRHDISMYSNLQRLQLTKLKKPAFENLWQILRKCTNLRILKVDQCSIEEEGGTFLASELQYLRYLQEFSITSCRLSEGAFTAIVNGLPKIMSLETISFAGNGLTPPCMWVLMDRLKECKKLCRLDLSCNSIKDEGMKMVAKYVPLMTKLDALFVSMSEIRNEGGRLLFDAIEKMENIRYVNISNNDVDDDLVECIELALQKCKQMNALDISGTCISVERVKGLFNTLELEATKEEDRVMEAARSTPRSRVESAAFSAVQIHHSPRPQPYTSLTADMLQSDLIEEIDGSYGSDEPYKNSSRYHNTSKVMRTAKGVQTADGVSEPVRRISKHVLDAVERDIENSDSEESAENSSSDEVEEKEYARQETVNGSNCHGNGRNQKGAAESSKEVQRIEHQSSEEDTSDEEYEDEYGESSSSDAESSVSLVTEDEGALAESDWESDTHHDWLPSVENSFKRIKKSSLSQSASCVREIAEMTTEEGGGESSVSSRRQSEDTGNTEANGDRVA